MTSLPIEAVQRRVLLFALLSLLLTGLLVSVAGFLPLASALQDNARQSLHHLHTLHSASIRHYKDSLHDLSRQVSSRSAIRQALLDHQQGRSSLAELRAFTTPRLQDALSSSSSLLALVRLTAQGDIVSVLGDTPTISADLAPAHILPIGQAMTQTTLLMPLYGNGPMNFLSISRILAPTGDVIGYDLLVFDSRPLAALLHQDDASTLGLSMYLAIPAYDGGQRWFQVDQQLLQPLDSLPFPAPSSSVWAESSLDQQTLASGPVAPRLDDQGWQMVIAADNHILYGDLTQSLTRVALAMVAILLVGGVLLVLLLRPLHGHLVIHTRDLEDKVQSLEALKHELEQERGRLHTSNQDLEQFAYAASHDLQQPLRMIAGFIDLLRRRYRALLPTDGQEFLDFAVDGATRMQHMIADLLEYSRVGRLEQAMRPTALRDSVQAACDNLSLRIAESRADITVQDLPTVVVENSQMVRVFQNLIDNAIKYGPVDKPAKITISGHHEQDHWVISVADNGIGIEPAMQKNAFRLFQRLHTNSTAEGTGMGLAMCAKIITHHGGTIRLDSTPDVGTTISFTLPDNTMPPEPTPSLNACKGPQSS